MSTRNDLNLQVDLQRGVVPISKAASSLAALIKWAHGSGQPVIVTQKGYPTGVLLPIELFSALKSLTEGDGEPGGSPLPEVLEVLADLPSAGDEAPAADEAAPKKRRSSSRRQAPAM